MGNAEFPMPPVAVLKVHEQARSGFLKLNGYVAQFKDVFGIIESQERVQNRFTTYREMISGIFLIRI